MLIHIYNILKNRASVDEITKFMNSEQFDLNDSDDNILNSFQEWLVENTDYDMEQEQKLSYDKQSGTNKTVS